jgi:transposase
MGEATTIGLDLAKHVFRVHGVDAAGNTVVRRQIRRGDLLKFFEGLSPCLVGMEACGTAHHWARLIMAMGHTVKLMPPAYVRPYVKRGKTDAADADGPHRRERIHGYASGEIVGQHFPILHARRRGP